MPAPRPAPPSDRPMPSPSCAKADWVMLTRRSDTLVVETEQECGKVGAATTLSSAYLKCRRRNEPSLRGRSLSSALKIAPTTADVADPSEVLRPASTDGGLSDRSTWISAASGSISSFTVISSPSGSRPSSGSERPVLTSLALGSLRMLSIIRRSE